MGDAFRLGWMAGVVVVCLLALTACAGVGAAVDRTAETDTAAAIDHNATVLWTFQTGDDYQYPRRSSELVFTRNEAGEFVALDADIGAARWSWVPTQRCRDDDFECNIESTANGNLIVGTEEGWITAVNQSTGRERWSTQVDVPDGTGYYEAFRTQDSWWNDDDSLFVGTKAGQILALDSESGAVQWRIDGDADFSGWSNFTVRESGLYTFEGSVVRKYDPTDGSFEWRYDVGSVDLSAYPRSIRVYDDSIFVKYVDPSGTTRTTKLGTATGREQWSRPANLAYALDERLVFEEDDRFVIRNRTSFDRVGSLSTVESRVTHWSSGSEPGVPNVFQTFETGGVRAIDTQTARIIWRYQLPIPAGTDHLNPSIAMRDGIVYLSADATPRFVALNETTGRAQWSYALDSDVTSVQADYDSDVLYVGTENGVLTALRPSPSAGEPRESTGGNGGDSGGDGASNGTGASPDGSSDTDDSTAGDGDPDGDRDSSAEPGDSGGSVVDNLVSLPATLGLGLVRSLGLLLFVGVLGLSGGYLYVGRDSTGDPSDGTNGGETATDSPAGDEGPGSVDAAETADPGASDASTAGDPMPVPVDGVTGVMRDGTRAGIVTYTGTLVDEDAPVRILTPAEDADCDAKAFLTAVRQWSNASTHPNVVTVYDWGEDAVPWALVGDAPGDRLSSVGPELDEQQAVAIVESMAEAIRNAGLYNTRHQALSPEVVWIGDDEPALVDDWGLTAAVDETGKPAVTPFTAPEQVDPGTGDAPGGATDVYRLGAVSYWLFTGRKPFGDEPDLATAITNGDIDPPSAVADVSPSIDEPIMRALETDPVHRYNSAYDFERDLRDAL